MSKRQQSGEITELLSEWEGGDRDALSELMELVESELKRHAQFYLGNENSGHTLQPTAIVNEVYLRLVKKRKMRWENRAQFFAFSGKMMRRILIDHARIKYAGKRGGREQPSSLDETLLVPGRQDISVETILTLNESLTRLEQIDPRQAKVVEYKFFAGLSHPEIASLLGVSPVTVKRDWLAAKPWLASALGRP